MTCRDIDEILMRSAGGTASFDSAGREHLRTCDRCRELAGLIERAQDDQSEADPAVMQRITGSVLSSLRPVRPLPAAWVFVLGLMLLCAAVAVTGASGLGMYGIRALSWSERAVIFPVLGLSALFAAIASAREMTPGSRRRIHPAALVMSSSAALLCTFALLFHDYRTDHFLAEGILCLATGLAFAVPAGVMAWWILRRGLVLNPAAAGAAAGTLAGLAGAGVLELHCPILKVVHLTVWHVAVVALSGLAGSAAARAMERTGIRRI